MISLKKILRRATNEHKRGYNMVSNPDSIKSRSMGQRTAGKPNDVNPLTGEPDPDSGNTQQANGAEIANKMDFANHKPRAINDKGP